MRLPRFARNDRAARHSKQSEDSHFVIWILTFGLVFRSVTNHTSEYKGLTVRGASDIMEDNILHDNILCNNILGKLDYWIRG